MPIGDTQAINASAGLLPDQQNYEDALAVAQASANAYQQATDFNGNVNWNQYVSQLTNLATAVVTTQAQKNLLAVQLQRAQQGLPPLDASQYGLGVNVGLSPQTLQYVGFGMIGLAALIFLGKRRR